MDSKYIVENKAFVDAFNLLKRNKEINKEVRKLEENLAFAKKLLNEKLKDSIDRIYGK